MKLLIIAAILQATSPAAGDQTAAGQTATQTTQAAAPSPDDMDCVYDRQTRSRLCTAADGVEYRCRRERVMGSRMPVMLCTTAAEDALMERESREALDRSQRMGTSGGN